MSCCRVLIPLPLTLIALLQGPVTCAALMRTTVQQNTYGQCKSVTLMVCAMLLQVHESKIAELDLRLKKEQQDKADAVKVGTAQAAYCLT